MAADACSALVKRHRSWCNRGGPKATSEWRPKKTYRIASKRWIQYTDNQLRQTTGGLGWKDYQFQAESPKWALANWRSWPSVGAALDQGSDGLCATWALEYEFDVNIRKHGDWSHGGHKDLQVALNAEGLFDFILVFMISANVLHGPDKDDMRNHQLRDARASAYRRLGPSTPLFQWQCSDIHQELVAEGVEFDGNFSLDHEVYNHCRVESPYATKGYRLNLNRFQGVVDVAENIVLPRWARDTWERSFVCLETDMCGGTALRKLILKPTAADAFTEDGAAASTSEQKINIEDRSFRNCLQNALVVSMLFLSDLLNKRKLQCFVKVSTVLRKWHGRQNTDLRSCQASVKWYREQLAGGFMQHVLEILDSVVGDAALIDCGFCMGPNAPDNDTMQEDEEMADMFGQYSLSLAVARQKRVLDFLVGYPRSMAKVLTPAQAQSTVDTFLKDRMLWQEFCAWEYKTKMETNISERSSFNVVSVKQYVAALDRLAGQCTPEFVSLIEEQHSGCLSTQIVEDSFGVAKNAHESKASNRYRKPERAWKKVLCGDVVNQRHHYKSLHELSQVTKSLRLDKSAYRPTDDMDSIKEIKTIASHKASVEWHSPGVQQFCGRDADLQLVRDAKISAEGWRSVRMAWLGGMFNVSHRFVFKMKATDMTCLLGGFHFNDSSVLCIEYNISTVPGYAMEYFLTPLKATEPKLISVFDLISTGMVACKYKWTSWIKQCDKYPRARKTLVPAVRMFLDGKWKPVKVLAAQAAFFQIPKTVLVKFAVYWGVQVDKAGSVLDVLMAMVKAILKIEDDEALKICHSRLVRVSDASEHGKALRQVDAAIQTFDMHDHEKVIKEIQNAHNAEHERSEFDKDYLALCAALAGKKKKKPVAQQQVPHFIHQQDAKKNTSHLDHPFGRALGNTFGLATTLPMPGAVRHLQCGVVSRKLSRRCSGCSGAST